MSIVIIVFLLTAIVIGVIALATMKPNKSHHNEHGGRHGQTPRPQRPAPAKRDPFQNIELQKLECSGDVYAPMTQKDRLIIADARTAVNANVQAARRLDLGTDFIARFERLVSIGEKLEASIRSSKPTNNVSRFHYLTDLWFRSHMAVQYYNKAKEVLNAKLDELHRINFDHLSQSERAQIIKLQKVLPNLRNMASEKARSMAKLNVDLKELIRRSCGKRGWDLAAERDRQAQKYSGKKIA